MPNATDATLGATLRAMREGIGWRVEDMAAALGVSKSTVSRYETGHRQPSPFRLAEITRLVADELPPKKGSAA